MEKHARLTLTATAVLLTIMLVWAAGRQEPKPVSVRAATAAVQDIYNSISVPGTVEAAESTAVCPAENGMVSAVYVAVGDTVQKGEVLCALSPGLSQTPNALDLQRVWAALGGQETQTAVSDSETALTSPADGTVLTLPQVGQHVYRNLPCVHVADLSRLQIRVKSPELYAGALQEGLLANITSAAAGEQIYAATVRTVAPVAVRTLSLTGESGSAHVEAVLSVRGQAKELRPGYSVTAKIFTDQHINAVVVPYEAVFQQGEQEYVFTVQDERAYQRAVTTGYLLENATEITEGLIAGETVLLSPPETLTDGDLVEVST